MFFKCTVSIENTEPNEMSYELEGYIESDKLDKDVLSYAEQMANAEMDENEYIHTVHFEKVERIPTLDELSEEVNKINE